MGLCLFMQRGSMMACGSESPIFRCWTRIIAACHSSAMAHGYILKMEMLTLSIQGWLLIRSTGGISGTESSTGAIPGWLRMKTAGGITGTEE